MRSNPFRPIVRATGVAALLLLMASECPPPPRRAVWTAPGSRADALEFQIGPSRGVLKPVQWHHLLVERCKAVASDTIVPVWGVERMDVHATAPSSVAYGKVPEGFQASYRPQPLVAGPYRVRVGGHEDTYVVIGQDGRVSDEALPLGGAKCRDPRSRE
jgi:hypothetical protein